MSKSLFFITIAIIVASFTGCASKPVAITYEPQGNKSRFASIEFVERALFKQPVQSKKTYPFYIRGSLSNIVVNSDTISYDYDAYISWAIQKEGDFLIYFDDISDIQIGTATRIYDHDYAVYITTESHGEFLNIAMHTISECQELIDAIYSIKTNPRKAIEKTETIEDYIEYLSILIYEQLPHNFDVIALYNENIGNPSEKGIERLLIDGVSSELANKQDLDVVNREVLRGILAEQNIQASGLVNEGSRVEIGKLSGANIIGYFSVNNKVLSIQIVDVETGISVGGINTTIPKLVY